MFLHFLNKNLQRAYFGPNLVLSTEDTMINKTNKQKKKQKKASWSSYSNAEKTVVNTQT